MLNEAIKEINNDDIDSITFINAAVTGMYQG